MKILVVGKGGREHAIAWRLASEGCDVLLAPGNWGAAQDNLFETLLTQPMDADSLRSLVLSRGITDVVVGPEVPLCDGLADALSDVVRVFGPVRACAELERSKSFAKDVMRRCEVPTAAFETFSEIDAAKRFVIDAPWPLVIKADGLAGGKGVVLPETTDEALTTLERMMVDGRFGSSGAEVVVEQRMVGPEVSLMVMTNGTGVFVLPTSRDHKRQLAGDLGPNTGGMGAISPSPDVTTQSEIIALVEQFITPVLASFSSTTPYNGFLYAGLMLTENGPRTLEYNVRMGDPETQALLFGLNDRFSDAIVALNDGFDALEILQSDPTCCVTLASGGYPSSPKTGDEISDQGSNSPSQYVFSAGIASGARTGGGRVCTVVGKGITATDARLAAYDRVADFSWNGMQYRSDIGST